MAREKTAELKEPADHKSSPSSVMLKDVALSVKTSK